MSGREAERFWARVSKTDGGCWMWTGGASAGGGHNPTVRYGLAQFEGRLQATHRIAYQLERGAIPEGKQLDHLCRVTLCVNPDHLEPVTVRENLLRGSGIAARNAAKTHCVNGHEFTPDNTYFYAKTGSRYCKACLRARNRAYYRRMAETIHASA